ncbi:putative acyl-protein thioesterase 1-like isoform 1 [Capsicum annuum]|nr:putative acyl-protein thioesterase 1-like isoform 1 [Capsicum annuum]
MATCFNPSRLRRSKSKPLELPSSSSKTQWNLSDVETMDKIRFDSLGPWSMILESDSVESWEVSKEDQEEWITDLSQLFIGNKFASGAHNRIYRGIYKKRAFAVKMNRQFKLHSSHSTRCHSSQLKNFRFLLSLFLNLSSLIPLKIRRFYGMEHGAGYDAWRKTSIVATLFDFDKAESTRPKGHVFVFGESRPLTIANMELGLKEIQIRGDSY